VQVRWTCAVSIRLISGEVSEIACYVSRFETDRAETGHRAPCPLGAAHCGWRDQAPVDDNDGSMAALRRDCFLNRIELRREAFIPSHVNRLICLL